MIFNNIEQCIGNTPLIYLGNFFKRNCIDNVEVYGKLECKNLAGSIKDRAALNMINEAEIKGIINKDTTIVEPTSGNTGIALAAIASARGYKTILTMPESMSVERRKLLAAYGAKIILTDASLGMQGAIDAAEEYVKTHENSVILGQFTNNDNAMAHYKSTGPEILSDMNGKLDILVATIGTGGTVTGIGKYLKEQIPDVKVIGVEPADSPFLSKGIKGSHKLQGIGAGFKPDILDLDVVDEIITIENDEAYNSVRQLASKDGLLVGISSGAAVAAAIKLAKRPENIGKRIVAVLPDSGERYLSTDLFE